MAVDLTVTNDGSGERIDKFLVRHLAEKSRSAIQKLISGGTVTINGKTVAPHKVLRLGDAIHVDDSTIAVREIPALEGVPEPRILFENDHVLVIDKPSGLTVHSGAGVRGPTLVDWLRKRYPDITHVGDDPAQRPGIVHRLDREVSGVMVVAKTQEAFQHLKQQFQERTVEKEYLALVHGIPAQNRGTIDFPIARSRRLHGRMAARTADEEGREAVTHYTVERRIRNTALLRIRIETGRTHQIRVHLKAIGHPIVGDDVYTTKPARRTKHALSRPFLHAARLQFVDLDGTVRDIASPLPEELRRFLQS